LTKATPGVLGAAGLFALGPDVVFASYGETALVAAADPGRVAEAGDAIVEAGRAALADLETGVEGYFNPDIDLGTPAQKAQSRVRGMWGATAFVTALIFVFAAVALAVAGLVIANTFQVLIAQRARTLALLRCIGASKQQIRRSVVIEGAATGLLGGLGGIVLGAGIVQLALVVAGRMYPSVPVPDVISLPWGAVVLPVIAGVGVASIASLAPARRATKTPPVAALRPLSAPTVRERAGRGRLILASMGIIGGGIVLAIALMVAITSGRSMADNDNALGYAAMLILGVLAAVSLVVGTILAGPFWIPRVVRGFAAVLARTGPGARVAAANTVRNPRRTAATAGALVIGVTLVATVSTGAASIERSVGAMFDSYGEVDFAIGSCYYYGWTGEGEYSPEAELAAIAQADPETYAAQLAQGCPALPAGALEALAGVEGVGDTVAFHSGIVGATLIERAEVLPFVVVVHGVEAGQVDGLALGRAEQAALKRGEALVAVNGHGPVGWSGDVLSKAGDTATFTLTGPRGSREIRALATESGLVSGTGALLLLPDEVLREIVPSTATGRAVASLAPGADAVAVADKVTAALADFSGVNGAVSVGGAAVQRATAAQVIQAVLLVLMALLAVAVLIALIGVANTLSLSVIERTREHGLLRALGLTRRQMRWMLALEGMSVAGIGAVLGIVLGTGLGWAGTYLMMSLSDSGPRLGTYPWQLAVMLVGGILAGLVASVLPGRRAAKTPPAAALAME
jgi:putative ABC transport system permease protein